MPGVNSPSNRPGGLYPFGGLVTLTHLRSKSTEAYFTVRATRATASALFRSLDLTKPPCSVPRKRKQNSKVSEAAW